MLPFKIITLTEDIFFSASLQRVIDSIPYLGQRNKMNERNPLKIDNQKTVLLIDGKFLSDGAFLIKKHSTSTKVKIFVVASLEIINILKLISVYNKENIIWIDKKISVHSLSVMLTQPAHECNSSLEMSKLTILESRMLKLYANGFSNEKISLILDINSKTLSRHKINLIRKLKVRSFFGILNFTSLEEIKNVMAWHPL